MLVVEILVDTVGKTVAEMVVLFGWNAHKLIVQPPIANKIIARFMMILLSKKSQYGYAGGLERVVVRII